MRIAAVIALALGFAFGVAEAQPPLDTTKAAIANGSKVQLEYTLTIDDGKVLDSNTGREPLTFTQGQQQIIPGLEKALEGMRASEKKKVTVNAAEAYGEVDPTAITEVPKERVPAQALTVGTGFVARGPNGETRPVRVKEIREQTVIIDLNHPLAGKTLVFDVKVLSVESPAK